MNIDFFSDTIEEQCFEKEIRYHQIDEQLLKDHLIVIHATPIGTFPNVDQCPDIPYEYITKDHVCFDLVYNPEETMFLRKSKEQGAMV